MPIEAQFGALAILLVAIYELTVQQWVLQHGWLYFPLLFLLYPFDVEAKCYFRESTHAREATQVYADDIFSRLQVSTHEQNFNPVVRVHELCLRALSYISQLYS